MGYQNSGYEKIEQNCDTGPNEMDKKKMKSDGCIYDPPYFANYAPKEVQNF